jgi:probable rRNA maturation factor
MQFPAIQFNFLAPVTLTDRQRLKSFLLSLFKKEKRKLAALRYIFCSDAYLLAINRQFLHHDFYTDILTFDLAEAGQPITAEVYISVDRVRENAQTFDASLKDELHRVIFHGALHLCGYKDKTAKDQQTMRKMEDKYLKLYNVPRGTIQ